MDDLQDYVDDNEERLDGNEERDAVDETSLLVTSFSHLDTTSIDNAARKRVIEHANGIAKTSGTGPLRYDTFAINLAKAHLATTRNLCKLKYDNDALLLHSLVLMIFEMSGGDTSDLSVVKKWSASISKRICDTLMAQRIPFLPFNAFLADVGEGCIHLTVQDQSAHLKSQKAKLAMVCNSGRYAYRTNPDSLPREMVRLNDQETNNILNLCRSIDESLNFLMNNPAILIGLFNQLKDATLKFDCLVAVDKLKKQQEKEQAATVAEQKTTASSQVDKTHKMPLRNKVGVKVEDEDEDEDDSDYEEAGEEKLPARTPLTGGAPSKDAFYHSDDVLFDEENRMPVPADYSTFVPAVAKTSRYFSKLHHDDASTDLRILVPFVVGETWQLVGDHVTVLSGLRTETVPNSIQVSGDGFIVPSVDMAPEYLVEGTDFLFPFGFARSSRDVTLANVTVDANGGVRAIRNGSAGGCVVIYNPHCTKIQLDSVKSSLAAECIRTICEEIEPGLTLDKVAQSRFTKFGGGIIKNLLTRSWDELVAEASRLETSSQPTLLSDVVHVVLNRFVGTYVPGTTLNGYYKAFGAHWWRRHLHFSSIRRIFCFATSTNTTVWNYLSSYINHHLELIQLDVFWIAVFDEIVTRPLEIDQLIRRYYSTDIEFLMKYPKVRDVDAVIKQTGKRKLDNSGPTEDDYFINGAVMEIDAANERKAAHEARRVQFAPSQTATSAAPTQNATSAAPTQNATSAAPTQNATSAAPTQNATSAAPTQNATSAAPTQNATSAPAAPAQTATSAVPAQNATSAAPTQFATSAAPTQNTTSAPASAAALRERLIAARNQRRHDEREILD
jgi:hypothetical protein